MIEIIILCAVSFVLTVASYMYLVYITADKENSSGKQKCVRKSRIVYAGIMLLGLCVLSILLEKIYIANSMEKNSKLITLLSFLFAAAAIDYKKGIIPNKLVLSGIIVRIVFYLIEIFTDFSSFWRIIKSDMLACGIVFLFFVVGVVIVKNGIGMGDIKLMLLMCLYQGLTGIISSLFLSLVVAFVISLFLLITKKKNKKDVIPFAPAILIGTYISVFMTGM